MEWPSFCAKRINESHAVAFARSFINIPRKWTTTFIYHSVLLFFFVSAHVMNLSAQRKVAETMRRMPGGRSTMVLVSAIADGKNLLQNGGQVGSGRIILFPFGDSIRFANLSQLWRCYKYARIPKTIYNENISTERKYRTFSAAVPSPPRARASSRTTQP